eukprot:1141083_1
MVSMRKILLGVCAVIIGSIVIISLVGTGKIRTPLSDYSEFVDPVIADGGKLIINLSFGGKHPKVTVVETSTTGTLQKLQDVSELAKKRCSDVYSQSTRDCRLQQTFGKLRHQKWRYRSLPP